MTSQGPPSSRERGSSQSGDERERALGLLRAHGRDATSFQLLEPGYAYFFTDDAFVAYIDTGSAWVTGGGPVAPESRVAEVSRAFVKAAKAAGRRVAFFAVVEAFTTGAMLPRVRVGKQPFWLPETWPEILAKNASLRYQVGRARKKDVVVSQVGACALRPGTRARREVDRLVASWIASRKLAPMGFLVELDPHVFPDEHLYLLAERGDTIVGFLSAVPIYASRGWLIEDLLRADGAPNGTIELLIDHAMRVFARCESGPVTLGLAPLAGDVPRRLRIIRGLTRRLFDFQGLHAFKTKLRPSYWEDVHVAAAPANSPWIALGDGLVAFARGSLVRFGVATLMRSPVALLALLTAALLVWTPLMSAATTEHWFPSVHVQHAWVTFDVLLATGLVFLLLRYRTWLAVTLAIAVTCDAILTLAEALTFNGHRIHGPIEASVVLIACAGPVLGALALWTTVRRGLVRERVG